MRHLKVSTVQTEIAWHNPNANQLHFEKLIRESADADILVLPEMFLTGFTMEPETIAEPEAGERISWLVALAQETGKALCGSLVVKSEESFYNRFFFITPEGDLCHYDKRHLFRMSAENEHYQAGNDRCLIHYRGWRILPIICYDLRFPVFCRNQNDYDLMICVANWPAPRRQHWRVLLQARAVENQAFVVGVNRVGQDGKGLEYAGDSMVISYKGDILLDSPPSEPYQGVSIFDIEELRAYRDGFPAWADTDLFELSDLVTRVEEL